MPATAETWSLALVTNDQKTQCVAFSAVNHRIGKPMQRVGAFAKCCGCAKTRVVDDETCHPLKLIQKTGGNVYTGTLCVKVNCIGDILAGASVHGSFHAVNRERSWSMASSKGISCAKPFSRSASR